MEGFRHWKQRQEMEFEEDYGDEDEEEENDENAYARFDPNVAVNTTKVVVLRRWVGLLLILRDLALYDRN